MMQGTLHRRVLEEHGAEAGAGAVMVLRDVSVYAPTPARRYLTVTPSNVLRVFGPSTAAGPEAEAAMRAAATPGQGTSGEEGAEEGGDDAALAALTQLSQRLASQDRPRGSERPQPPRATHGASRRLAVPRSEPRRGPAAASAQSVSVGRGGGPQPGWGGQGVSASATPQVQARSWVQAQSHERAAPAAAPSASSRAPSSVDADVDALLAGLDADDFLSGAM